MPIETSPGQLTPFRRRGHLFFFSLAKPACRQTGRQAAKKSNRSLPLAFRLPTVGRRAGEVGNSIRT